MGNWIGNALGGSNRLGRRLVLYMVLASAFLSVVATALQLYVSFDRDRSLILQTFDFVDDSFRPSLEKAVWEFNFSQVNAILDGIAAKSSVHSISLTTATGQKLSRGPTGLDKDALTRSFVLKHVGAEGVSEVVGKLIVALTLDSVYARVWDQFRALFLSNLAKTTLASLVMLALFHVLVARHLRDTARHVAKADWLNSQPTLALRRPRRREPDDLENVVNAINEARSSVLQSVDKLNREVRERQHAEREATKASEAKSAFLATMSHEVRTPINAIMGLLELIERADIPERQRKQAIAAHAAAEGLLAQLTNVIEMSRLDAKSISLTYSDVAISELADNFRGYLDGSIQHSKKPLRSEVTVLPSCNRSVRIDKRRVSQIVSNLVDNATRFTEDGSIKLSLSACRTDQSGVFSISVEDTGIGIASRHLESVFDRFTQIDDPVIRSTGGSGLGLAICKGLAELMGGSLTVSSCIGTGSKFTLQLPIEQQERGDYEDTCVGG